jgi:PAS domain S-box-containing protein
MVAIRVSDEHNNNKDNSDFVVRKRPLGFQLALIFSIALVVISVAAAVPDQTGSSVFFFVILTATISSLGWITFLLMARNRDLVLSTEFMNALLAAAAQHKLRFCLIIKPDGSAAYADPGFHRTFPQFMRIGDQTIHSLLADPSIPKETSRKIADILDKKQNGQVIMQLTNTDGAKTPLMVSIDALPRPKGYFLLRGRDYVENRSGAALTAADTILTQTLNALTEGVVLTNAAGKITYVNPVLENLLGYKTGQLSGTETMLGQLLHHYAGHQSMQPVMGDYEGEAALRAKDGGTIVLWIRQTVLQENDRPAGVSIIIANAPPAVKKN